MAVEAPISKFKKHNILFFIAVCIAMAGWFGYDGYINKKFIEEHTNEDGSPNSTLIFNKKSPPFFVGAAVLLGVYFYMIKGKRLLADENELIINNKNKITYDSIEKIDKTYFDSKGFFVITYKNANSKETNLKISDRAYDGIDKILDYLVEKIS